MRFYLAQRYVRRSVTEHQNRSTTSIIAFVVIRMLTHHVTQLFQSLFSFYSTNTCIAHLRDLLTSCLYCPFTSYYVYDTDTGWKDVENPFPKRKYGRIVDFESFIQFVAVTVIIFSYILQLARRLSPPESLNASLLGGILRRLVLGFHAICYVNHPLNWWISDFLFDTYWNCW